MDRGAWQAIVHGVAKSWTQLSENGSLSGAKVLVRPWPYLLGEGVGKEGGGICVLGGPCLLCCRVCVHACVCMCVCTQAFLNPHSLEKTLMLGEIEDRRRRGRQRMRQLDGITDSTDMNLCKPWEMVWD